MESISQIKERIAHADLVQLKRLEEEYARDERKGVREAFAREYRNRARALKEQDRLNALYAFERHIADERGAQVICGLDEVGRGAVAGPLAVGAVVLDPDAQVVEHLDDSKRLSPQVREQVSACILERSLAHAVFYVEPNKIDEIGIAACLKDAFLGALACIEEQGVRPEVILIDGNPLHIDEREVNVIKGDAKCASIAAASVIAKVARDALMVNMDAAYPGYGFSFHKGYGSAFHRDAIKEKGLSAIHRKSFCTKF